ncbi:hypothetical protein [Labrys neptuniae]
MVKSQFIKLTVGFAGFFAIFSIFRTRGHRDANGLKGLAAPIAVQQNMVHCGV